MLHSCYGLNYFVRTYAGHSKWANIRHIKALKDGQRSVLFTRMARQLRLAITDGGGSINPKHNSLLRSTMDEAIKRHNMPASVVASILERHNSKKTPNRVQRQIVEARLPGKGLLMICTFDTNNLGLIRTSIGTYFRKANAHITETRHNFDEIGRIIARKSKMATNLDSGVAIIDDAIECDVENYQIISESDTEVCALFVCASLSVHASANLLEQRGYTIDLVDRAFEFNGTNYVRLVDEDLSSYQKLCSRIRTIETFHDIYDNLDPGIEL